MWSSRLIAALHSPTGKPRISLNRLGWANTPGQNTATARSTWNTAGVIGISPSAGFSVASQSIGVPDWTSNRGPLRIGLGRLEHAPWALTCPFSPTDAADERSSLSHRGLSIL